MTLSKAFQNIGPGASCTKTVAVAESSTTLGSLTYCTDSFLDHQK